MEPAYAATQQWAAGDGLPWLVLRSDTKGLGKTHLAIAAAAACIDRGESVAYWVVTELLNELRATQRPGAERTLDDVLARATRAGALVLDDLGAGRATEFADEQLFTILNARYARGLRTLVTTNRQLGELEDRIRSRLVDWQRSLVVRCQGRDYRERRPV